MSKLIRLPNKNFGAALLIGARSSTAGDIPGDVDGQLGGTHAGRVAFSRAMTGRILNTSADC